MLGMYDEDGLKALDYVIHSASKHGIKLILSFIDNWKYYNGVDQVGHAMRAHPTHSAPTHPPDAHQQLLAAPFGRLCSLSTGASPSAACRCRPSLPPRRR
jgi:hypothetical protein